MWACLQCFMFMNTHTHTANATIHYKEIPWTSTMNMSIFICFPAFGCLRENELSWRFFMWCGSLRSVSLLCVRRCEKQKEDENHAHTNRVPNVVYITQYLHTNHLIPVPILQSICKPSHSEGKFQQNYLNWWKYLLTFNDDNNMASNVGDKVV